MGKRAFRRRRPARPLRLARLLAGAGVAAACMAAATAGGEAKSGTVATPASAEDFAGRLDVGNGRRIYLECRGRGAPVVLLLSGLDAGADLWQRPGQPEPTVFTEVARRARVCAYDRPGTPTAAGLPSRSDPVPQPTVTRDAVSDLHALLRAAALPGPYVLVGHSYAGLVARLYASTHPDEVAGMVLVDTLSEGLQDAMTPADWETWKKANARQDRDIAEYPDLERIDFDVSLDQVRTAPPLRPQPLIVLSADVKLAEVVPRMLAAGDLPADTPPDFGAVIDRANGEAQAKLARLVPGAKHRKDTRSGHDMMIDQPRLVIGAIEEVVATVRERGGAPGP